MLLLQGEVEPLGEAKQPIVAREKVVPLRIAVGRNDGMAGIPPEAAIVEIVALITIEVLNITEIVRLTMALDHEVVQAARAVRTLTAVPTASVVQTRTAVPTEKVVLTEKVVRTLTAVPTEKVVPMPSVDRMDKVDFAVQARVVAGVAQVSFEDGAQVGPKLAVGPKVGVGPKLGVFAVEIAVEIGAAIEALLVDRVRRGIALNLMRSQ